MTSVRPVWVILGVPGADIHEAVQSEAVYIGELRRGSKRGPKKGSFGVIWGSKRAVLTPFWGPYLRGLKKGLKKGQLGLRPVRPGQKAEKGGPKKGSFGVIWGQKGLF